MSGEVVQMVVHGDKCPWNSKRRSDTKRNAKKGAKRTSKWEGEHCMLNCDGLLTTTRRLYEKLKFDWLGLTETQLVTPSSSRSLLTTSAAPADDRIR